MTSGVRWGERGIDTFQPLELIGEGTYGTVWKALDLLTMETVALKMIRVVDDNEGIPITALREIKILKDLEFQNIIKLKEVVYCTTHYSCPCSPKEFFATPGTIFLVLEYLEHDLAGLLDSPSHSKLLSPELIKRFMAQILSGLSFLHSHGVLHRDIKGHIKLADFGLSRFLPKNELGKPQPCQNDLTKRPGQPPLTNNVVTLWYRPPELLLGSEHYSSAVDMWSVGCLFAEMLLKRPLFTASSELELLDMVWRLVGTPDDEDPNAANYWPEAKACPLFDKFQPKTKYKSSLRQAFEGFPPDAVNLLEKLLTLDPSKRPTALESLEFDYFKWMPPTLQPEEINLLTSSSAHEYTVRGQITQEQAAGQHPWEYGSLLPRDVEMAEACDEVEFLRRQEKRKREDCDTPLHPPYDIDVNTFPKLKRPKYESQSTVFCT